MKLIRAGSTRIRKIFSKIDGDVWLNNSDYVKAAHGNIFSKMYRLRYYDNIITHSRSEILK